MSKPITYEDYNPPTETVPCGLCGTQTTMTRTKRCDSCWELERRIQMNPQLAAAILAQLNPPPSEEEGKENG